MESDTKLIVFISLVLIGMFTYIGVHLSFDKPKDEETSNTPVVNNEENINQKEEIIKEEIKFSKNIGKEMQVQVNNESDPLAFYLLQEDENTYTLIAKDSLSETPYYKSDTCNENNEESCVIMDNGENVNNIINEKVNSWTNVGEIRLPKEEEISQILNKTIDNTFISDNSFWVFKDEDKESAENAYFNKDSKTIMSDKKYNLHSLVPVITILKSYVS